MANKISYDIEIIAREYEQEDGLEKTCVGEKTIYLMSITDAAYRDVRDDFITAEEAVLSLVKMVL